MTIWDLPKATKAQLREVLKNGLPIKELWTAHIIVTPASKNRKVFLKYEKKHQRQDKQ